MAAHSSATATTAADAPGTDRCSSTGFDPDAAYRQSPQIGLRPEPFGALAYHFVTRRLVFLKNNELVALVEALAQHPSADAAIDAVIAPDSPTRRATYHKALASLLGSGVIEPAEPAEPAERTPPAEPVDRSDPDAWVESKTESMPEVESAFDTESRTKAEPAHPNQER